MNRLTKQLEEFFIFRSYLLLAIGILFLIMGFVLPPVDENIALFGVAAVMILMFTRNTRNRQKQK